MTERETLMLETINKMRNALLGIEFTGGACPECGEPEKHYAKCHLHLALADANNYRYGGAYYVKKEKAA